MNKETIIRHIEHYAKSGIIADELICYYDQNGRWRDDSVPLSQFSRQSIFYKMRKSHLPVSRRTRTGRFGAILLTSLIWSGKNPITITYPEIEGDVIIDDDSSVHAAGLFRVGGKFLANNTSRIYLPQLVSVGGCFEAVHSYRLKAPRLSRVGGDLSLICYVPPRIESVGGRFGIYWVDNLSVPKLRQVGGALVCTKAEAVEAPLLETIRGGFLLGSEARKLHAPCLQSVGGDFLAAAVTDLRLPRSRSVGGDLDTRSATGYYHPDLRVEGEWTICPGALESWFLRDAARKAMRGKSGPIYL